MTGNILADSGKIKEIVVKTKGTPTQKLLAILMLAGIDKTADLAEMTGLTERAIQTAKRNLLRETDCVTQPIAAKPIAETQPIALLAQPIAVARVEETNLPSNLVITVASEEVQCSEVLLRSNAKPKKEAHGTRLDREWQLPDDWRQWARTTFPQSTAESVTTEAETFRDYWIGATGQKARKADWEATWRNWCRRNMATAPIRPRSQPPPQANGWEVEKAAKLARAKALYDQMGGNA